MTKNICQAYTKKGKPCKNYAMKVSHFCYAHKRLSEDFPPVKITTEICPYCDEPLEREAKFCAFCNEDLIPATPKSRISLYFSKFIHLYSAGKHRVKSFDWFFAIIFLMLSMFSLFLLWSLVFELMI